MDNEEKIRLGAEARQLLNNPLLSKFFSIEATRMFNKFCSPSLTDDEATELHRDAAALNRLRSRLEQFIKTGEIEEHKQYGESTVTDGIGPII